MVGKHAWSEKLDHLRSTLTLLETGVAITNPSDIEKAGVVQLFEVSFELSWKVLQAHLSELGFIENNPRDVLKRAFASEIIVNGEVWLRALADRNTTTHIYDEVRFSEILSLIRGEYTPAMRALVTALDRV